MSLINPRRGSDSSPKVCHSEVHLQGGRFGDEETSDQATSEG